MNSPQESIHQNQSHKLPTAIFVGPFRTGTTWLHSVLQGHVNLPHGIKETLFFNQNYSKGVAWYQSHFRYASSSLPTVEVAPSYFHSSQVRARLHEKIPDARILCTVRNPVDRLFSHYQMLLFYGRTEKPLLEALDQFPELLEAGRYSHHITEWQKLFGAENVTCLFFEDLRENPQLFLDQICDDLQIPRFTLSEREIERKPDRGKPRWPLLARTAHQLGDFLRAKKLYGVVNFAKGLGFRSAVFGGGEQFAALTSIERNALLSKLQEEIEQLEAVLGRDLSSWKK